MSVSPGSKTDKEPRALPTRDSFRESVADLSTRLKGAFMRVLAGQGAATLSPALMGSKLGLRTALCRRLVSAISESNPYLVMHRLPGVHGLRGILRAAAKEGVSASVIREAQRVVDDFAQMIAEAGGSQEKLHSMLSDEVPAMRRTTELRSRAAIYKGMVDLYGHSTDVNVLCKVVQPNDENPELVDVLRICAYVRLRRLRRMAPVVFSAGLWQRGNEVVLNGRPTIGSTPDCVMPEFCSQPVPALRVIDQGPDTVVVLAGDQLRRRDPVTIVWGFIRTKGCRAFATDKIDTELVGYVVSHPAKLLVQDTLVRNDLWVGVTPRLEIHRTGYMGGVEPENYHARWFDRLEHLETLQNLGRGLSGTHLDELPQYRQILETALDTAGWDAERFSGYRCKIVHPVLERQVALVYDLPQKPASP